jgi:glutamate synthase domain-containing protein 3
MQLSLEGEANDYVGKGMSGGEIAIRPPQAAPFTTPQAIAGNTNLYGATGGALFVAGKAGERFGVRNSGATAVVEGVGDHGCEYMTGGRVVVLGETGLNFGAGMTNGEAWVWDPAGAIAGSVNAESVTVRPGEADDLAEVRSLVERHVAATGSARGQAILDNWEQQAAAFWRIEPLAAVEAARLAVEAENETDATDTGAADCGGGAPDSTTRAGALPPRVLSCHAGQLP